MVRLFLGSLLTLAVATNAFGGDTSRLDKAVFADDGRAFLMIESGFQDGSGAAYIIATAVDVDKDRFLPGFPNRVQMDEQTAIDFEQRFPDDPAAREEAMMASISQAINTDPKVQALLASAQNGSERAARGLWEADGATNVMRFDERDFFPPREKVWRLDLAEKDFPAGEECFGFTQTAKGFRLALTNEETDSETVLNDDARVPASRACPLGYSLHRVLSWTRRDGSTAVAILLSVSKLGFEGPDRRFQVVTTVFPPR